MSLNVKNRTIFEGDNLDVLRGINSDSIDLIYLDPPFNSNRTYSAPIGSAAAGASFKDAWTLADVDEAWHGEIADREPALYRVIDSAELSHGKGMKSYLIFMAVRLLEMKRILKNTGSIYLHCDPTASHYLKLIMDCIFGKHNFRNDIAWKRLSGGTGRARNKLPVTHDVILFYAMKNFNLNQVYIPLDEKYVSKFYRYSDKRGLYQVGDLTAAGTREGDSGMDWRGISVYKKGKHWNAPNAFPPEVSKPKNWSKMKTREKLDYMDSTGLIYWPKKVGGMPRFKRYLSIAKGVSISDMFLDIPAIQGNSREKVGYPTQKPLALLERLIKASSNEGDMVLDPFCGCATTCVASETLQREWVGIDLSPLAVKLVNQRLRDTHGLFGQAIHRTDIPKRTDLGKLLNYRTHKHGLYGKQEGLCGGCKVLFPFRNMTIDHVVPRVKGGQDDIGNLQLLCGACNSVKGTNEQSYLIAKLKEQKIIS